MKKNYLDVMSETEWRRLVAESETRVASLGDVSEGDVFGADVDAVDDVDAEIARRAEVRHGR